LGQGRSDEDCHRDLCSRFRVKININEKETTMGQAWHF
jgi:hypothetical protein